MSRLFLGKRGVMYVHKRWVFTAGIVIVLLVGALFGMGTQSLRPVFDSGATERTIAAHSSSASIRISAAAPATPEVSAAADPQPSSGNVQVNTRGFGDIGMQFQNTWVSGQILNDHISSQGNDNITNSNVGQNNTIINSGSTCPAGGCH